jgi:hypothetical protein
MVRLYHDFFSKTSKIEQKKEKSFIKKVICNLICYGFVAFCLFILLIVIFVISNDELYQIVVDKLNEDSDDF